MQVDHKPTKILIVGKSGSGKSTYQTRYVSAGKFNRFFIFDHKTEFAKRCGFELSFSLADIAERIKKGETHLCYHYSQEYPGESETAFQDWCEFVYDFCNHMEADSDGGAGNSLFVCDEVNRFTTTSDMGGPFKQLIEDGRLQGIDFIGTSHASNQISNRLRLQLSEIVALKTIDPRPLQFLEECGFDPEEVSALDTGQFICKNLDRDIFVRGRLFACNSQADGSNEEAEPESDESDSQPTPLETQGENDGPLPVPASHDH